jgi:hypothetical protein
MTRFSMRLDPRTTVESLLRAIPSSALVFEKLGIKADGNRKKSLQEVCTDGGIVLEEFLRELDEIDWEKESLEGGDQHLA